MRNDQIQISDGPDALKSNAVEEGVIELAAESYHVFWIIRNRGGGVKANDSYFFDLILTKPDKEETGRIVLKGSYDSDAIARLNEVLEPALMATTQTVILDLSEVDFITAEGILALIETSSRLFLCGVRLLLTGLQPQILRVFRVWNALPDVQIFRSRQEMTNYIAAMQKVA